MSTKDKKLLPLSPLTCKVIYLLFTLFAAVSADNGQLVKDHWPSLNQVLNEYIWPMRSGVVRVVEEVLKDDRVFKLSPACNASLAYFVAGLRSNREDAFRILDSWSKVRPGLLSGEYADLGHWDQCVSTVLHENWKSEQVTGQYCLYHLSWPLHESYEEDRAAVSRHSSSWIRHLIDDSDAFRFAKVAAATCIPSTCTRHELQSMVDAFAEKHQIPLRIEVAETCDTVNDFHLPYSSTPIYKQTCGYLLLVLVTLVILCTLGVYLKPNLSGHPLIRAFDAKYNSVKLNYSILDREQSQLSFIHGFRTIYLAICIWAHILFVSGISNKENHMGIVHFQGPSNPILTGLTQMSGLLVSWNVVVGAALAFMIWHPIFEKTRGRISFLGYLVPRVLRSTPVMAGTLMLIFAYPPSWGSGPVFRKSYARLTQNCLDSWWMELLYIGNQRKAMQSCIVHGWYIASDLQLYAVAFVLMHAFYKSARLGVALCTVGVVVGMAAQGFATWYYNTGMSFAFTIQRIHVSIDETHLLHFATLNYISSYCIGILLGYVISHKIKVQKKLYLLGWAAALLLAFGTTYWHHFLFKQLEATRFQIILTAAVLRTILAIIGAWAIYSMWIGMPILTWILSRHLFLVLGRINFSTFMVHMLLIWHNDFHLYNPVEYKPFSLICRWITELFFAHILGYLMYLIIEAPFNNLAKLYLSAGKLKLLKEDRDFNANEKVKAN